MQAADRKSASTAQVNQCYVSVRNAPAVFRILDLIDVLATNSIIANTQALATSEPNDPLTNIRRQSLERLLPARAQLRTFGAEAKVQTPTVSACHKLAQQLGVDDRKLRPKGARG